MAIGCFFNKSIVKFDENKQKIMVYYLNNSKFCKI